MLEREHPYPIFDGHNDVLTKLDDGTRDFFQRGESGHIDLPRARDGGLAGGFCAIFARSDSAVERALDASLAVPERLPEMADLPDGPDLDAAQRRTVEVMARLFRIERESDGQVKVVRTAGEIETCLQAGVFAALLHIEGAEAIDPGLDALEVFYQAGLRSLGPVWSRRNVFAEGVPFGFGHNPDTGPGLTSTGRELIRACSRLGIMIDLSHINERGFWDVAEMTGKPLVATHSNAWSVAPATRNLTDRQLDAIRESDGMVGVNFATAFLREDGRPDPSTPLHAIIRHVDYLTERVGIDRVGFGSDFDGAQVPAELGDASGLPRLLRALQARGYDELALRKLTHQNWIRVLRATWGG